MIELHPTPIYVIHLNETDGDIIIKQIIPEVFEEYLNKEKLGAEDYAVIKGNVLKSIDTKSFDLNQFILKTKGA